MSTENAQGYIQRPQGYFQPTPYGVNDDEIDLLDLVKTLFKHKLLILGIAVLCSLIAVAIALLTPPVYKASAHLLPPVSIDVQTLNQLGEGISSDSIYSDFKQNANSLSLKRAFFDNEGLASYFLEGNAVESLSEPEKAQLFEAFLDVLGVDADKKNADLLSVSLEWSSADRASELVNQYIQFINERTLAQAVDRFEYTRDNQLKSISQDIAAKRNTAEQKRMRSIEQYKEALAVARSLNIVSPLDSSSNGKAISQSVLQMPSGALYYRGSKALEAEIQALSVRENDDAFISSLGALQERIERIKLTELDKDGMQAVRIDSPAFPPLYRVKPKRSLIVIMGAILGVMLGVMAALFVEFISVQKAKKQSEEESEDKKDRGATSYARSMNQLIQEYEELAQLALRNGETPSRRAEDRIRANMRDNKGQVAS